MPDDFSDFLLPTHGAPIDPVAMARRDLRRSVPARFYKEAAVVEADGHFALVLDGKPAFTPARKRLAVPSAAAAAAIAAEWNAQEKTLEPATMPLTRLVNSALDGVAGRMAETRAEILKYAGSDLVCYRAGEPDPLVEAQAAAWDPILAFARDTFGARFICAEGIVFATQPDAACAAFAAGLDGLVRDGDKAPLRLAALDVVTTLTGSALIAAAVAAGALSTEAAWGAAHVDEDYEMRLWGQDIEALARRARRFGDMATAVRLWQFLD
jgi:chaperone required for assembly of F1-ATPase